MWVVASLEFPDPTLKILPTFPDRQVPEGDRKHTALPVAAVAGLRPRHQMALPEAKETERHHLRKTSVFKATNAVKRTALMLLVR